jgi:hypothetical protein
MAKALNPNSGRQIIMKVMYDHKGPITPAMITAKLKEQGHDIKYLHSHLNYFKTHGQIWHLEDKSYQISAKMMDRLDVLYKIEEENGEMEEVVLVIDEMTEVEEMAEELVEA